MLEKIGIYGMEKVESAILAGLVTGDPVLLVGSHGTAKTLLCSRLAKALGIAFWAYDASKALFEDVLGFPDPTSLARGQVEYVPTPISIWGKEFVLIDELSRANPSMQNKWLEIIRSRRMMGKSLPELKYIFAAMNPPTYLGTHPLDEALAGRFAIIIPIPGIVEMPEESVCRIMTHVSEDDAPMLKINSERISHKDIELAEFVKACQKHLKSFSSDLSRKLGGYVMAVSKFLASREIYLDGRRLGMVWRTLQAYLAVEMEKLKIEEGRDFSEAIENSLDYFVKEALSFTMPFIALDKELAEVTLKSAHYYALPLLNGGTPKNIVIFSKDPYLAVEVFIRNANQMLPEEIKASITQFISKAKSLGEQELRAKAIIAMLNLAEAVCQGKLNLTPEDQYRVLSFYREATLFKSDDDNHIDVFENILEQEPSLDFTKPAAFLAFRLGFKDQLNRNRSHYGPRHHRIRTGTDTLPMTRAIYEILMIQGGKE